MRRRFFRNIGAAMILGLSLAGCVQATRHSNTMLFGTNTVFGIDLGQNANSVPSITVGYRRQEAVIMPLVANTSDNGTYQAPCQLGASGVLGPGQRHPCLLIATRDSSVDSYSVLASFGADFSADVNGTNGEASGGLAQFFATGVAAQMLALNGGAALVATGRAAERRSPDAAVASLAALTSDPQVVARSQQMIADNQAAQANARAYLTGLSDEEFPSRFTTFITALGESADFCGDKERAACTDDAFNIIASHNAANLNAAIAASRGQ